MFPVDSQYKKKKKKKFKKLFFFSSYERKKILQIRNLHLHKKRKVVKEAFIKYLSFLLANGPNIKISLK